MDPLLLKRIIEAVLMAAAQPLTVSQLAAVFSEEEAVDNEQITTALAALAEDCAERGIELKEVASGFRYQIREDVHHWVTRLWTERQTKYSRALLETLALIAYRQPITRAEIEQIRGVAVSTSIVKTLEEREWVRVVGYRDVPGRPALFGTSRNFLDYFNLKSLDELPPLAEIRDLDDYEPQLDLAPVVPPSLELPPEDIAAAEAEAAAEAKANGTAPDDAGDGEDEESVRAAAGETGSGEAVADTSDADVNTDPDADSGDDADADAATDTDSSNDADSTIDDDIDAAAPIAAEDTEAADTSALPVPPASSDDDDDTDAIADAADPADLVDNAADATDAANADIQPVTAETPSPAAAEDSTAPAETGAATDPASDVPDAEEATDTDSIATARPAGGDGDFLADALEDAPEAADDWSDANESALDSDDTPDFADSDFSPDDEDVDPLDPTTSDDVPEHNA